MEKKLLNKKIVLKLSFVCFLLIYFINVLSLVVEVDYSSKNSILSLTIFILLILSYYFIFNNLIHFWKNSKHGNLVKLLIVIASIPLFLTPMLIYYLKRKDI